MPAPGQKRDCQVRWRLAAHTAGVRQEADPEAELWIPVYDSIAVTPWKSLLVAGVDPVCVKGWGSLFNTLRTQAHEALPRLLVRKPAAIVLNEHTDEDGATVFWHACKMGLEWIVSKRLRARSNAEPTSCLSGVGFFASSSASSRARPAPYRSQQRQDPPRQGPYLPPFNNSDTSRRAATASLVWQPSR
jgi:hypothetical protein